MSDEKTALQEVVASYLRKYPDFFTRHPDVLEVVEIRHQSGTASSLIERQVEQLRTSNQELERQLKQLLQVASENERLMSRLHRLTLELMSIGSRQEFFTRLGNRLLNDFDADVLQIFLFDGLAEEEAGEHVTTVHADDPALEPFRAQLEKGATVCGRLGESKLHFLFGSNSQSVQSTALVPLGDQGTDGMMAIGSSDPARFYPGMGTLFLDLLANVISSRLSTQGPTEQRRSA